MVGDYILWKEKDNPQKKGLIQSSSFKGKKAGSSIWTGKLATGRTGRIPIV